MAPKRSNLAKNWHFWSLWAKYLCLWSILIQSLTKNNSNKLDSQSKKPPLDQIRSDTNNSSNSKKKSSLGNGENLEKYKDINQLPLEDKNQNVYSKLYKDSYNSSNKSGQNMEAKNSRLKE